MSTSSIKRPARSRETWEDDCKWECKPVMELEEIRTEIEKYAQALEEKIDQIIKSLDQHHNNVNVAKIAGNSAAIGGGVVALLGALFAPATGGASLVAAAIASSISAAGGTISGGASLTGFLITKDYLQTADTCMKKLQDKIRQYKALADNLALRGVDVSLLTGVTEAAVGVSAAAKSVVKLGKFFKVASRSTGAATKTVGAVSKVSAVTKTASVAKSTAVAANVAGKAANTAVGTGRSAVSVSKATLAMGKVSRFTTTNAAKVTGQTVAKGFGKGFIALNAILLPVSIYDMYQAVREFRAGQGSSASPGLTLLKEQLGEIARGNF